MRRLQDGRRNRLLVVIARFASWTDKNGLIDPPV